MVSKEKTIELRNEEGRMSLDDAIIHAEEVANAACGKCANQHRQLAQWLRELRYYRKKETVVEIQEIEKELQDGKRLLEKYQDHGDLASVIVIQMTMIDLRRKLAQKLIENGSVKIA